MERDGYVVVVAGGGPAGLTAGLTAARPGHSTLVVTGGIPGGLVLSIDRVDGVPGFPDGVAGYGSARPCRLRRTLPASSAAVAADAYLGGGA